MSAPRRPLYRRGEVLLQPEMTDGTVAAWLDPGQRVEVAHGIWAERLRPSVCLSHDSPQEAAGTEHIDTASRCRENTRHSAEKLDGARTAVRDVEGCTFTRLEAHGQPRLLVDITIESTTLESHQLAIDPARSHKPNAVNSHFNEAKIGNPYSDAPLIQVDFTRSGSRANGYSAPVMGRYAARFPNDSGLQLNLIAQHCPCGVDHAENSAKKRERQGKSLLQLNACHFGPVCVQCRADHSLKQSLFRLAWLAVALISAAVIPLRIAEIHAAHAERDAAKARWAASTSVRG
ncbi:hypothetical protein [Stenotrophomonas maltophilia]|uniref:Uncharacterized protein n=1 Tax=Stenotrophomonas maltophilia TaxID=40324 RepID=A0AAJ2MYV2_STEMA|nr:hypothetical protein [Stenotrophomonas maltophilia]MDT3467909.1 hypothetical protein [Stenotrophomonas maltophilia]